MRTKIELRKKSPLDRVKEIATSKNLFVRRERDKLTIIFDGVLSPTQIQKIKDKLENTFHIDIEKVEGFPTRRR